MNTNSDEQPKCPDHFEDLVRNGADFLKRSVDELLDGDVKFSAVHFYQAVELFVKARLLREHWSLVVADPARADRGKFERGDFQSVSLPEAVKRLDAIVEEDIGAAAKVFDPVRKRRNRVVHFHASEYPFQPSKGRVAGREPGADLFSNVAPDVARIVAEQCLAWYELHLLLTVRWKSHFREFSSEINWLNRRMLDARPYVQARFDKLKPEIERLRQSGASITECFACGFPANTNTQVFPGMIQSRCIVCLRSDRTYRFCCPETDCTGDVEVAESAGGECDSCGHVMSIEDVVCHLQQPYDPTRGDESSRAFCSLCESYEVFGGTVEWVDDAERYICFSCLEDFNEVSHCEWCYERITGDAENTYWRGCMMCDGHAGHVRD